MPSGAGGPGNVQFRFSSAGMPGGMGGMPGGMGGMPGGMGGMPPGMGGMGGLPPEFAAMMGGMGGMPMGGMPMGGMPPMGGRGGRGQRSEPEQPNLIPAGAQVVVRGLRGAAQHNGKSGQVVEYDASTDRYVVAVGEDEALRIKFDNLVQTKEVEVTGMQNRPELNGKLATIVGYDEEKNRYHADIMGTGRASLQLSNLILSAGTRGKVTGLTSESGSKWNDKVGQVVSFDREAGRYLLQMTADDQLRIKPVNLKL